MCRSLGLRDTSEPFLTNSEEEAQSSVSSLTFGFIHELFETRVLQVNALTSYEDIVLL